MNEWWEIVLLTIGCVLALLVLLFGLSALGWSDEGKKAKAGVLDKGGTVQLLADVTAEAYAQMQHLERIFRRDRIIGQARRELRDR